MDSITCESRAKINLFLEIKGKRDDGYHELHTVYQEISLADSVALKKISEEYSILKCNDTTVPFGRRNLCIKAFELVRESTHLASTVEIEIEKKIPLGAGLGGGSSNGACVITGLNKLFDLGMDDAQMAEIAAKVGSDVPFFIYGGAALGTGRGEIITPLPSPKQPIWLVLVKPGISVSTGNAFQWVKGYKGKKDISREQLENLLPNTDAGSLSSIIYNAFEPIVLKKLPELARYKEDLLSAGCIKASMTGCGSAFYGICESEAQANQVAATFADRDDVVIAQACHTV